MTYKGIEIGKAPTLFMVKDFLREHKGLVVDAKEFFEKYERRHWMTSKGRPIKKLETMIVAENGVQVERMRREAKIAKKKKKNKDKPKAKETTKNYSAELKDPRWQKKRLEIYQRDNWTCQICGNGLMDGVPLNIHHRVYYRGYMPWEYENSDLVTICEKCHAKLHKKS